MTQTAKWPRTTPRYKGFNGQIIFGDDEDNNLVGGDKNDRIDGKGGNDIIKAGKGNDLALGGRGNDRVDGGDGNDFVFGVSGDNYLTGGAGNDWVSAKDSYRGFAEGIFDTHGYLRGQGPTTLNQLHGGDGDDLVTGAESEDHLYGGDGQDVLYGAGGKNYLYGGRDNDTLVAGNGVNIMNGGAGLDSFVFLYRVGTEGSNRIVDFTLGEDVLKFRGIAVDRLTLSFDGTHTIISITNPSGQNQKYIQIDNANLLNEGESGSAALQRLIGQGTIVMEKDVSANLIDLDYNMGSPSSLRSDMEIVRQYFENGVDTSTPQW